MASAKPETQAGQGQADSVSLEQRDPLLRTKLFVPPARPNGVIRPRLFEQIDSGLDKALILVSAPAGYGKTTLVSSWLRETDVASAWLSLDEDDNDPVRFMQYFITALQIIVPTLQLDLMGALPDRQPASFRLLLNIIINEIAGRAAPFVFVLDDFHTLHAQPVLDLLVHLLEHLPPPMHVALISRTDPPLPLARLRARRQLADIRADQLRFTPAEMALFLNEVMGLTLSTPDILALEARTEGWIAGLQLAAIALQAAASPSQTSMPGGNDLHGFISAFTGSHYYILDYLAEEVLRLQTETVRLFLLRSSILGRMCGALCDEVVETGQTGSVHGQAMLETLEQMNLFIVPLDSERRWYRYHHLFADVLNRRLEQLYPDQLPDLHRRASRWYEQHQLISDAIHHARLAGDLAGAARLVDQHGCQLLIRGEVVNLLNLIEAVEPHSQTLPWIAIQKTWALCLTGQLDRMEGPLQAAERLVAALEPTDEARTMSGAVTAARACRANMRGETRQAADLAQQALDCLPVTNDFSCSLRGAATAILGDASWSEGNLAEAERAYTQAKLISQAAGNIHLVIIANCNLADTLMEQGHLQPAARLYSETLGMTALPDGQISPMADRVHAGLGMLSYERNRLEAAAEHIRQCLEFARRWGRIEFQPIGQVLLARLEQAQGNPEKAREAVEAAEQWLGEYQYTPWRSVWLKSALAGLWISLGDLERAAYLLQKSDIPLDRLPEAGEISHLQEPGYLVLLRLHLAQGNYEAALALSERLRQTLDETNRLGRVVELLVVQALAFQGEKDLDRALAALEKAFALARPDGYVRVFLDEGEPMAKLLYQARARRGGTGYAAELLSALGHASGGALPPAQLLIEPLTQRELELLKLIEAGYSNQKIAAKLVISLPTVKRHISNIYIKLGASSRTQAVSRGKELGLFK